MKRLVAGIFTVFALLMGTTLYIAATRYDGLVEERYYERSLRYLPDREKEEAMGLSVGLPGPFRAGRNRVRARIETSAGPLAGARVTLSAARIAGEDDDRTVSLAEEAPGRYAGDLSLPAGGRWLFHLGVAGRDVSCERTWFAPVGEGPVPLASSAGHQRVVLDVGPRPVRAMRDLTFTVELPGHEAPGAPWIELSMPDMRMPPNRVDLVREAPGLYRGKGVVVRCARGGRTWIATVTVPGKGKAAFTIDVAD